MFCVSRHGLELNQLAKHSINLLIRLKFLQPQQAFEIEIKLLTKYNTWLNKPKTYANIGSVVSVEYLKARYYNHLKKRAQQKSYSIPVIRSNSITFDYELDANVRNNVALPCTRCNYLYAELKVTWSSSEVNLIEVPNYEIYCSMCGFSRVLDLSGKIDNNAKAFDL